MSWRRIPSQPVLGSQNLFFIFAQTVWCRLCTLGNWSFLTMYVNLYPPVNFPNMIEWLLQIIMLLGNLPGIIYLWIFTSAKHFLLANSTLQFSLALSINFMTLSNNLYIIIIFVTPRDLFPSALVGCLTLEFEWLRVSVSHKDSLS